MKVLLDTCVWGGAKAVLQADGYDVIWAGDWDTDPGDEAILAQAYQEKRVLVTLDKILANGLSLIVAPTVESCAWLAFALRIRDTSAVIS